MKKITKLMLTLALAFAGVGVNSVKAEMIVTKTPVILTGGKFAECFTPGTYVIQMEGWRSFIAYKNDQGVAFDENSTMVFDLEEAVANGSVRVTFTFSDGTTSQAWWCLGIGNSADDPSTPWGHVFDNSTFWLKKGLGNDFDSKKDLMITKVTVDNFNLEEGEEGAKTPVLVTYKVRGGTLCGQPMNIQQNDGVEWGKAQTFGAYGGVFTATDAFTNIFQMKDFAVGDYQKMVIKFGEAVSSTGGWNINNNSGFTGLAGKTEYEFALDGTAISDFTIFNWDANPYPINISEVYLYKEEASEVLLTFNDYGFATSNRKDLKAEGGLSFDPSTGILTSNGSAGTLTLEFTNAVNLEDLNTFDVKRSGNNNIVNRLKFYDSDNNLINTWNNAKWYNSGLDYNATNAFKTHNAVKKLVWEADEAAGNNGETLTISGIEWQLKTISAMRGTDLTTLPYKEWSADGDNDATVEGNATPQKNIGVVTGSVVYGSDAINASKKYVDLTNYKKLIVRGYGNIRLFYNWHQSTGEGDTDVKPETSLTNNTTTVQTMELDIPAFMAEKNISHFHLVGIKTNWGAELFVESVSVLDGTEKFDYTLSGKGGLKLQTAVDALADVNATAIDATALTNDTRFKESLTTANPNCLIFVNTDQLSNTSNVVVDGTCANLVLTDNHPFKAPVDFTATSASYATTINTTAKAGTLCLPFAAAIPSDVTAYTLTYTGGDAATATEVESTIPANTPVLLNGSGSATFIGNSAAVSASATNTNGALTGVFEAGYVPANSYVLQNNGGVGFYKVGADNSISIKPFRAYLTAQSSGSRIKIIFDGETTGISTVETQNADAEAIYSLNGVRVNQPVKGIYVKNGKKFVVK